MRLFIAPPGDDDIKISQYMDSLIKKGTDEDESNDEVVKNIS